MRSPPWLDAGALPAEAIARGTIPFDEAFLEGADLSSFQRKVAVRLLCIPEALPDGSCTAQAVISRSAWPGGLTLFVNFVPRREGAAEITVFIQRDEFVDVGAGRDTTFGLPHDVWDPRAKDVSGFTEQIVSAIVNGKLRETIYYRGDLRVRYKSELEVEGPPVLIERLKLLRMLRGVFRKRSKKEVTYTSYA